MGLGYDVEMQSPNALQRSMRFLDHWDDRRVLELGAIHFCSDGMQRQVHLHGAGSVAGYLRPAAISSRPMDNQISIPILRRLSVFGLGTYNYEHFTRDLLKDFVRANPGPEPGDIAPDFTLRTIDGDKLA